MSVFTLNSFVWFILGIVFCILASVIKNANFLKGPRIVKPFHERHLLNFKIAFFLKRISPTLSRRWQVTRVTYDQDILTSILSTFNLIDVVSYYFRPPSDDLRSLEIRMYYHTFRSFDDLEKKIYKDTNKVIEIASEGYELFYIGSVNFDTIWEEDMPAMRRKTHAH